MKIKANKILAVLCVIAMLMTMIVPMTFTAAAADGTWTLVTDVADLAAGDQVIIAAAKSNFALSTTQNTNNRAQAAVTKSSDNTVTFGSDVQILTLENGKTAGTFAFNTGKGYLYAASSSKNYLKTETSLSANSSWTIEIANTGVATIKSTGSNTRNWLRYNSSNNPPLFAAYSSGQADVVIYKLVTSGDDTSPSIRISGDTCVEVGKTITLTATAENVSGTVAWDSSNEDVATVVDGVVTANAMGKTTITAEVDGISADVEISVFPVANSTITVAEALEVCNLTGSTDAPYKYSVIGEIESIDDEYSSQYNNITITIKDDAASIKVYRAKGGEDLAVGDKIKVTGTLVNYGSTTPEFTSGATYEFIVDVNAVNEVNAYMSMAFKYTEDNGTLSDSQFVLNVAVDAALANIKGVDAFGIKVTAGGKTVLYTVDNADSWKVEGDKISVSIALGDIINDTEKLETEFTVGAFIELDGDTYDSEMTKTYSVKTMVAEYNNQGITEVAHLYGILFPLLIERRDETMKKNYTHPEVELIKLSAADVLSTSYNYDLNENDPTDNWEW